MFIGGIGIFIQILIQAAILRLSLKIIAKHEADTTYHKAIMVTAGVSIGQFIVLLLAVRIGTWAVIPAVIAFTAAVIMYFCWISFWKSLMVVFIYMGLQLVFLLIVAVVTGTGASILGMSGAGTAVSTPAQHQQVQEGIYATPPTPTSPSQQPEPVTQPNPTPLPKPVKVEQKTPAPTSSAIDWDSARKSLIIGGIMPGGREYLAMINGKMVRQGEVVTAQYGGREYRWRVKTVTSKEADLEQLDALLETPQPPSVH